MAYRVRPRRRQQRKSQSPKRSSLQKPNGVISPRVQKVGGERFAIVCVDPAKHRSEWMMADYFGNVLIETQTLEHQGPFFRSAMELIRQSMRSGIACLGGTLRTLAVAISRTLVDFFLRFVTAQLENLATPKPTRKKSFSTRRISEPLRIFDLKKMEDIFCRAGGNILVQLRAAHPDNTTSDEPFDVSIDGERKRINAGEIVRLHPESLRN